MSVQEPRPFMVDFIDPLFAVAIHIGFTHGLAEEEWFKKWRLPHGDDAFNVFVLLLGFMTITWSWVGYHQSIARRPLQSQWRFIFDVAVVLMYIVILVQYRNFAAFLMALAAIYLLY